MLNISDFLGYFKDLRNSLKFQLSATITFGIGLLLIWNGFNESKIYFTVLCLFPACMFLGSIIEKIVQWREAKKKKHQEMMKRKSGLLGSWKFTDILNDVWPDQNYSGLAWQILINIFTTQAFIREPVCSECQTNLITNKKINRDGFYLECTDCSKQFDVDDIGKARERANASLQGEVRRNPDRFFLRRR